MGLSMADAIAALGRLDVVVNNAGRGMKYISSSFMTEPTRFWEADASAWSLFSNPTYKNHPHLRN